MPKKVSWALDQNWGMCLFHIWLCWENCRNCGTDFSRCRWHWGSCRWCRRGRWGSRGWRGRRTGRRHTWWASRLNWQNFTDAAALPRICTFRPLPASTRGIVFMISAAHEGGNFFGAFPAAGIPISFNLEILTNNNLIPSVFSRWFFNKSDHQNFKRFDYNHGKWEEPGRQPS